MKKQLNRLTTLILTMILCIGITACGEEKEVTNPPDDLNAEKTQETTVSGPINVKDYYSFTQNGSELEYTFDTSKFDQNRYDGKFTMAGVEVTFPLGTVPQLQAMGIDFGENAFIKSEEELLVNRKFENPIVEPDEQTWTEMWYGHLKDGVFDSEFYMKCVWFTNLTDKAVEFLNLDIGAFYIEFASEEKSQEMAAAWGIEDGRMTIDTVVEKMGLPIYYQKSSSRYGALELYYYYGDYTLLFTCDTYGSNAGNVVQFDYATTKYIDHNYEGGAKAWAEYKEVCDNFSK